MSVSNQPYNLVAADFDNDGKIDLATANQVANSVSVFQNIGSVTGNFAFASPNTITGVNGPNGMALGDLDSDGKLDIAITNYNGGGTLFLHNTSTIGSINFVITFGPGDSNSGTTPSIVIADFDNDGKADVITARYTLRTARVFRNISTGPGSISFAPAINIDFGYGPNKLLAKDVDNDGKIDLLSANFLSNTVSVLRNTSTPGTVSFEFRKDWGTGTSPVSITSADYDGDGKLDLGTTNQQSDDFSVIRNASTSGSLRFEARTEIGVRGTNPAPSGVGIGDLDGDGRPDVVNSNRGTRNITVFRNLGTAVGRLVFDSGTSFPMAVGQDLAWVVLGDINGDGRLDAISAGTSAFFVSTNLTTEPGQLNFAPGVRFTAPNGSQFVGIADFDLDGKLDVATANRNVNTITIFRNISATDEVAFEAPITLTTGLFPVSMSFGDFDSDGKMDILAGHLDTSNVSIFRNTSSGAGSVAFEPKVDLPTNSRPEWVAAADFDGDGKTDVALSNGTGNTTFMSLILNTGSGPGTLSFGSRADFFVSAPTGIGIPVQGALKVADMDGDAKPDIIAAGFPNGFNTSSTDRQAVFVMKNTSQPGSPSLLPKVNSSAGRDITSIDTGDLNNDNVNEVVFSADDSGNIGILEKPCAPVVSSPFDYDGDGLADVSVFRPSDGMWYLNNSSTGFTGVHFGQTGDLTAPGDFDGDGKADISVFRPSVGDWFRLNSSDGTYVGIHFGASGDLPAVGDFDGDGKADISVFRPSVGDWYRLNSSNGQFVGLHFGANEDKPAVGDFDGDGKSDISVFRPSVGDWYRLDSSNGQFVGIHFGISEDKPTPADYDGDGRTDISVYRPSSGDWFRLNSGSGNSFSGLHFGTPGDTPVAADYDGDGKADIAVFRPSEGNWYMLNSTAGYSGQHFGLSGDMPTPASFVY